MTRNVTIVNALDIVSEIFSLHLERRGSVPAVVVMVGGTALAAHQIRDRSEGVDLYVDDLDDDIITEVAKRNEKEFGEKFKIDATPSPSIWGVFDIKDISESPICRRIPAGKGEVDVRVLDLLSLYVIKSTANRPKDREDRTAISKKVQVDQLLKRAGIMLKWVGDRSKLPGEALKVASHVAADFEIDRVTVLGKLGLAESVLASIRALDEGNERKAGLLVRAFLSKHPGALISDENGTRVDRNHPELSESLRDLLEMTPGSDLVGVPPLTPARGH